jgi:hypothetical protein
LLPLPDCGVREGLENIWNYFNTNKSIHPKRRNCFQSSRKFQIFFIGFVLRLFSLVCTLFSCLSFVFSSMWLFTSLFKFLHLLLECLFKNNCKKCIFAVGPVKSLIYFHWCGTTESFRCITHNNCVNKIHHLPHFIT